MSDPVIVFCETFTGPKGRSCYCVDIEPEKCSNCLAEEALKHYLKVLARLENAMERAEKAEAQTATVRNATCLTCGRALPPDGDCYGCESDRLTTKWIRLREVLCSIAFDHDCDPRAEAREALEKKP